LTTGYCVCIISVLISKGKVMEEKVVSIETRDDFGFTKLHIAARSGKIEEVVELLKQGADIEAPVEKTTYNHIQIGYTALHMAARKNRIDVLKHLLRCDANINATGDDGHTPLSIARVRKTHEAVKVLEDHLQSTATIEQAANGLSIANKSATEGTLSTDTNRNAFFSSVPDVIYKQIAEYTSTADTHSDRQIHQTVAAGFNRLSP